MANATESSSGNVVNSGDGSVTGTMVAILQDSQGHLSGYAAFQIRNRRGGPKFFING